MRRLAYVLGKDDLCGETQSVDDVDDVARRFRDAEIDILALNGGDGTNHVTLTSFVRVYKDQPLPMIALLRGGTMNTISNAIGVKGNPSSLLVNIVEKYYLGQSFEISERDLLRVSSDGRVGYGFIFGTGFVANFLDAYYATGNPSPRTAAKVVARGVASALVRGKLIQKLFAPSRGRLYVDGEFWQQGEYKAIVASTIEQVGLGFRPFIRCEAQPKSFHALAFKASGAEFSRMLLAVRLGRPLPQRLAPDRVAKQLIFRSEDAIGYTVDGDMYHGGREIVVETGPRVRVVVK